jgi:hypothetical protein
MMLKPMYKERKHVSLTAVLIGAYHTYLYILSSFVEINRSNKDTRDSPLSKQNFVILLLVTQSLAYWIFLSLLYVLFKNL